MIDIYRLPRTASPRKDYKFPCLVLNEDSWNDFGHETLFHAVWFFSASKRVALGSTKILERGKTDTEIQDHFHKLGNAFCSLGQTISYYEQIHELGQPLQDEILSALRDIVAYPQIGGAFENDSGFRASLLRFSEAEQALKDAGKILDDFPRGQTEQICFTYSAKLLEASARHRVTIRFGNDALLPCRIVAFIGKNATGKTWLLSQLAADISGDQEMKGRFRPSRPAFGRVIAVSYNALDRFRRPPKGQKTFSYHYCGIYDQKGNVFSRKELLGRIGSSYRKLGNAERLELWEKVLAEVFDKNFAGMCRKSLKVASATDALHRISSGQMVLLTVLTELLASLEKNSLVLYDEPELHLHPNAISAMMRHLSRILKTFDSFAIVATHSPLIIQQIPAAYVKVFTRIANQTFIKDLSGESFGENLSVLTETVFEVNATESLFSRWLKTLPASTSEKQIVAAFSNGLSFNAKSVIRTIMDNRRRRDS